ncbi:DUF262 domain-containing protein [Pectobacterium aroidearum]|uniref:DUF262 domain-containing protein n=1 Tax=Pectobacterium aroidearum TaxID=1201031 RepID=UPI001CD5FCF7|nr:DUF262 domain-containing protein [Pectobacterium aroidearum]
MSLEEAVSKKRNTLKTDRLDMSFGEIMNLYDDGDLIVSPEYQRLFRWDNQKQSRFIESVILGIPIPPIFVAEDSAGKWELVDGLQRTSTILSFFGALKSFPNKNNLVLNSGDMIPELEGVTFEKMPTILKASLKRSVCRVEILRWDSSVDLRYELFNRLNTGSEPLTPQEVRNCIFRGDSDEFNKLLKELSLSRDFLEITNLTEAKKIKLYDQEIILRFFALYSGLFDEQKLSIQDFMTDYMRRISTNEIDFDYIKNKSLFLDTVSLLNSNCDSSIFRAASGGFAEHLFDAITQGVSNKISFYKKNPNIIPSKVTELKEDRTYGSIGTETYSKARIIERIRRAREVF